MRRHWLTIGAAEALTAVLSFLHPVITASVHAAMASDTRQDACPTPPAAFNILTASSAERAYYGLPRPPRGSAWAQEKWAEHIAPALHHRMCAPVTTTNQTHHSPNVTTSATTYYSYIWSGYVATEGNSYYYATADWNVPCYISSLSPSQSRAVEWVGLGGYPGSTNLWQAGTESDPPEGYRFWYDAVPAQGITYYGPPVTCGDHVSVEVDWNYSVSGESYAYMANYTQGKYQSKTLYFQPNQNSAEWIIERPSCRSGGPWQLADFNDTNWTNAWAASSWYYNGSVEPPSAFPLDVLQMTDDGTSSSPVLAWTYGLTTDGHSWQTDWRRNGTKQNSC